MEDKFLKQISEIDVQLEKNKEVIDKFKGMQREDIPDKIFDKVLCLSELSKALMIFRNMFVKESNLL